MSSKLLLTLVLFAFGVSACASGPSNHRPPSPGPSTAAAKESISELTLPVLDALLHEESFVKELQSQLQLSGDQIVSLKRVASADVTRLREANAEETDGDAAAARDRASREIVAILALASQAREAFYTAFFAGALRLLSRGSI